MKTFYPSRLKSARKGMGWSLRELAERMPEATKQAISQWENGNAKPTYENVRCLSEVFKKRMDWFYTEPTKIKLTIHYWCKMPNYT